MIVPHGCDPGHYGDGRRWRRTDPAVPDDALAREIQDFVRTRLAAHSYPREVHFAESLPMTATGKVMRREIRSSLAGDGPGTGRS